MPASWLSGTTGTSSPAVAATDRAHGAGRVDHGLGRVPALVGPHADDDAAAADEPGDALVEPELRRRAGRAAVERVGREHRRRRSVLRRVGPAAQALAVEVGHELEQLVAIEPVDVQAGLLLDLQQRP